MTTTFQVIHRYRPFFDENLLIKIRQSIEKLENSSSLIDLKSEYCFNIEIKVNDLPKENDLAAWNKLDELLSLPLSKRELLQKETTLLNNKKNGILLEVAPRLNFTTAWSTNAVSIAQSIDLLFVNRIEVSRRFYLELNLIDDVKLRREEIIDNHVKPLLHDRMTEFFLNEEKLKSFELNCKPEEPYEVDILQYGRVALEKVNQDMGLAMDEWDLDYYTQLFRDKVKRNPTNVECFDLAQSNSEHSRHWFFKGRMFIDGKEKEESLFDMIMSTQEKSNSNNVIAFNDNSSAIKGFEQLPCLLPTEIGSASSLQALPRDRNICFTAETHNFPTGVAPFSGATTGTGGRIRDVQSTGRGAHVMAGTAGYCFGNLNLDDYKLDWEDGKATYTPRFAHPSHIAIEASNGASDYGNKFGEPLVSGFARSFGMRLPGDNEEERERMEWIKPIMFSGGLGSMEAEHTKKFSPEEDMLVVKVGGPVYRIGVGGGAASSVMVQGDNKDYLDFDAVQRGDAEMEQKMNRVIRSCIELLENNPICSIHDQGAGGNGNVLKEISEPLGALIEADEFQLGDPTLTILEIWGAEYQETNALLIKQEDKSILEKICKREKCPVSFVGKITNDGHVRLRNLSAHKPNSTNWMEFPVNLKLDVVLGKMPRKVFHLNYKPNVIARPLQLPSQLKVIDALQRVLRLPSVASKRYLTNKVDRSVTGLCAQQQCVGPFHTPLADVAVVALSQLDNRGSATAIGEQPIKGILSPACGARLSVAESLTNLCMAHISDLRDVKCSGNWMWPAKLDGEGLALWQACEAMCQLMRQLGIAIDGGKDSLGMAARVEGEKFVVKSPGAIVISTYAACPDVTKVVTPDIKASQPSSLIWIQANHVAKHRVGGTALAQVFNQLGDECPDIENAQQLADAFNAIQQLIDESFILSGHDISDGGLITCLLEMSFAGHCGLKLNIVNPNKEDLFSLLFHEEPGWIIEVANDNLTKVIDILTNQSITHNVVGSTQSRLDGNDNQVIHCLVNGEVILENIKVAQLRDIWEQTSYHLELRQCLRKCVEEERNYLLQSNWPVYFYEKSTQHLVYNNLTKSPTFTQPPRVAVLREEGSNGDREMIAAFYMAGFEVWDVNTQDLLNQTIQLNQFRGLVFVGGFSYADVLGSAKGWAAGLLFHKQIQQQIELFRKREDTFSLGVCNGCQLMALIGFIGDVDGGEGVKRKNNDDDDKVSLINTTVYLDHNVSGRYESRFPTVKINDSPSIMLKGMQGSQLGIWVAHGEGRFAFRDDSILKAIQDEKLIALQYIDANCQPTVQYPCNPNGSVLGIAGIVSKNGRHLAMMPHPERCVQLWQWPYRGDSKTTNDDWLASPWLQMFHNAFDWCSNNNEVHH